MESSEDEDVIISWYFRKRKKRRFWVYPYFERRMFVAAGELHDPVKLKSMYKMSPTTFLELLDLITPATQERDTSFRRCITADEKLLITLRLRYHCQTDITSINIIKMSCQVPQLVGEAVLKKTVDDSYLSETVCGYDWNKGLNYHELLKTYLHTGFQATNFGLAVNEVNKMIECRKKPLEEDRYDDKEDPFISVKNNCTIFLGYTSNIVSSGLRETILFLVQHKMVDCIVATAGGIEEDFIKCLAPTYLGDFKLDGKKLRDNGINRIGNLLVPNDNYCKFEDWVMPLLDEMLTEQKENGMLWTPSRVIQRLGERINNEESIYYWAALNRIPVFSPALTDGSLGDMMFFHSFKNPGLIVDIVSDLRRLNMIAIKAIHTGVIIIGGGVIKHHICNANLMRNGTDYAVYLNTASEFDGSDSGATPDEAVSWGKIKKDATPVKICAEASLIFPLLVGETFANDFYKHKRK